MIICCCNQAYKGCEKECPKGLILLPRGIIFIRVWERRKLKYEDRYNFFPKRVLE